MQKQDLQQIRKVVREEVRGEIRKNNVTIYKKIDNVVDEIAIATKSQFDEHGKKFDEHGKKLDEHGKKLDNIQRELEKRPTKDDFSNWRDKQIQPIERDVDKLKYIHRDTWKNLPDSGKVSRILVKEGIKN